MTHQTEIDQQSNNQGKFFESDHIDLSHIRLRPSQFARMMGCSKQAVSIWIRKGKISLGIDGRMDPSQAIAQLLRNSNPNQIRLKALTPLIRQLRESEDVVKNLKNKLSTMKDDLDFYEGAVEEYVTMFDQLKDRLSNSSEVVFKLTARQLVDVIIAWLNVALENGPDDLMIEDFIEAGALGNQKRGEGVVEG